MTIAGESAGSWSVFHHLLSPTSEGLFRGVIGQSGTMISELADRYMTRLIYRLVTLPKYLLMTGKRLLTMACYLHRS